MEIIDLTAEHERLYFVCLEDWSDEMKEAGDHKETWYGRMKDKGLRVKLALGDDGAVCGMIQYLPIEHSFVEGSGLYFIPCIWVHGYKQGVGNRQKHGMGKALLEAAENDARALGAHGMAAWGLALPIWMKASWYRKRGYRKADRQDLMALMWKPFDDGASPPRWIRQKKQPETEAGKVTVTAFKYGWCPAYNIVFERAKRAAAEFGDDVLFREIDTCDPDTFEEWGVSDALYVDSKQVNTGPPPPYEKIRKKIEKRVRKL